MSQLSRVTSILAVILEKPQALKWLANRHRASLRTIYRDIEILRELGYPVKIDAADPLSNAATAMVSMDESAIRNAARVSLSPYVLSAVFVAMQQGEGSRSASIVSCKLASVVSNTEAAALTQLWRLVVQRSGSEEEANPEVLRALQEACDRGCVCEFEHRGIVDTEYRRLRFAPFSILPGPPVCVWGRDTATDYASLLEVRRIRNVRPLQEAFWSRKPKPMTAPPAKRARIERTLLRFMAMIRDGGTGFKSSAAMEVAELFRCADRTIRRDFDALASSGFGFLLMQGSAQSIPALLFSASEIECIRSVLAGVISFAGSFSLVNKAFFYNFFESVDVAKRELQAVSSAAHVIIEMPGRAGDATGPFWALAEAIRQKRRCWIRYDFHGDRMAVGLMDAEFQPVQLELDQTLHVTGYFKGDPELRRLSLSKVIHAHLIPKKCGR